MKYTTFLKKVEKRLKTYGGGFLCLIANDTARDLGVKTTNKTLQQEYGEHKKTFRQHIKRYMPASDSVLTNGLEERLFNGNDYEFSYARRQFYRYFVIARMIGESKLPGFTV